MACDPSLLKLGYNLSIPYGPRLIPEKKFFWVHFGVRVFFLPGFFLRSRFNPFPPPWTVWGVDTKFFNFFNQKNCSAMILYYSIWSNTSINSCDHSNWPIISWEFDKKNSLIFHMIFLYEKFFLEVIEFLEICNSQMLNDTKLLLPMSWHIDKYMRTLKLNIN